MLKAMTLGEHVAADYQAAHLSQGPSDEAAAA